MSRISNRLAELEAKAGTNDPSAGKPWHNIVQEVGQSWRDAIADYGRDRIGVHDNLMMLQLVSPRLDATGRMVPPLEPDKIPDNWREMYR